VSETIIQNMITRKLLTLLATSTLALSLVGCSSMSQKEKNTLQDNDIVSGFQNPSREYRPHVRMWVPQAAEDETELRRQIAELAAKGFGDVEIVAFDLKEFDKTVDDPSAMDAASYAWGTDAWTRTMEIVLDEAGKNGIKATFTIGPAWPVASPLLSLSDPGVEVQLGCQRFDIESSSVQAELPQDWFAVVAGKRTSQENSRLQIETISDVTSNAVSNGELSWTAPDDSGLWSLLVYTNEKVGETKSGIPVVDHFSMEGTKAVLDYYQGVYDYLKGKNLLQYLNGLFGDSLEYRAKVDWTPSFVETFKTLKGYDITPYLPILNNGSSPVSNDPYAGIFGGGVGTEDFGQKGEQIKNDYYAVLTYLFNTNHLDPIQKFLEGYDQNLRYQTAYGKHMEQSSTSMHVGIPEGEMMMIRNSFDNLRAQSGAAHLMGRKEYNAELQAESGKNHAQSWENVMFFIQRAFSVGVNNLTLHGYNYTGRFNQKGNQGGYLPGVAWPGWEGFGREGYSNSWGAEPLWQRASDYTSFIARTGFALKQGTPKVDLAVFRESYWDNASFTVSDGDVWYKDGGLLQDIGYSFDFVGLDNLNIKGVEVKNKTLCPNGPSYKAMILDRSLDMSNNPSEDGKRTISLESAKKILSFAKKGLPVVIVGEVPSTATYYSDNVKEDASKQIGKIMNDLLSLSNVKAAKTFEDVPSTLVSLGVTPDVSFSQEANKDKMIASHNKVADTDIYYIYNRGNNSNSGMVKAGSYGWGYGKQNEIPYQKASTTVTLSGTGTAYVMNAWTGEISPLQNCKVENGKTVVDLSLEANESVIIALDDSGFMDGVVVEPSKNYSSSQEIILDRWDLEVESWTPSTDYATSQKTMINVQMSPLKAWKDVPSLENVSGIGHYTASFDLEKGWENGCGAEIDLGIVNFSYVLCVNGKSVPVSQTNTRVDIGKYLVSGSNTVEVIVYTTLNNAIKAITPAFKQESNDPIQARFEFRGRTHDWYGLMGKDGIVTVKTYQTN